MSAQYIYTMHRVQKFHGPERQVLRDISLSFYPGAKIGVLGPNGAGKSTLLRIMAGLDEPSSGRAELAPGATVGLLSQEPQLDPAKDVRGNVEDGVAEKRDLLETFNQLSQRFAEPMSDDEMAKLLEEQGEVQDRIERLDAWNLDRDLDVAMDALRCPPSDADVATLSGGERRRVALCRLLLSSPDLLLLDEPTNHLDAESVAWLETFLERFQGTVLAVTHDRYFLDNVAGWILELDRGHGIPFQGNYSSWLEQKEARLAVEEKQTSARRRTLQRELEWVRMAPRARHAKSKARLDAYEKLLAEEQNVKLDSVEIHIPAGERLGDKVVEAKGLSKGFGDRLLIEDLSFSLPPGGIVGVIGPNGAGKTTLFRMIVGDEKPDGGALEIGESVQIAYVDQGRAELDPAKTVWQEVSGGKDLIYLGKREVNSRAYVASFNFRGGDQQKRVGDLSGGERNRLHLAKLLRSGGNLLLLDEPTNDLDVDTLRALEVALDDFAGCAVVISHDRWFLNRVATHMLAFEGDSQVTWFEGSYDEYEEHRRKLLGDEAAQPHRITYKPLVRT
jgi:ATP-binding cassette ChvD family protein